MSVPAIDQLSPSIIPHHHLPTTRWYRATGPWYYHRPTAEPPRQRLAPDFYDHVDRALRPLVRLLHHWDLRTTPSCQGHFHPREHFERVWAQLARDRRRIRAPGQGLRVTDSETGERFRFHAPDYELPWRSGAAFCDEAMRQQGVGYLGVLLPPARAEVAAQLVGACDGLGGVHCPRGAMHGQILLALHVDTGDPDDQEAAWARITERLLRQTQALHQSPAPASQA